MPISGNGQGGDHDIIDQFFGDTTGQSSGESRPEFAPSPDMQNQSQRDPFPKDSAPPVDPGEAQRWQYQQARADKYFNELAQLREEQARTEHLRPLAQVIESDPELLSLVEKRIQGMNAPAPVQAPQAPAKPDNFNTAEAADPNTPSGKYMREMDAYREARLEYIERRAAAVEQRLEAEQSQRAQQQKVQSYMMGVRQELVGKHQFTPEDADQFFQIFTDPRSRSTPFLAEYYRFLQQKQAQGSQPRGRETPLPPMSGGRPSRPQGDDQARFSASLQGWIAESKKKRF